MKILLASLLILSGSAALACQEEAQVIAPIKSKVRGSATSCKAYIDLSQVRFYAASMVCALDLSAIASEGVEVGLSDGRDCKLQAGEELNGVVIRTEKGLFLE